ncbi:MAG: SGNH/GDSL hydrolase family protein, partial [Pseudohongiellaceae bacterium]
SQSPSCLTPDSPALLLRNRLNAFLLALALLLPTAPALWAQPGQDDPGWVTTWSASPSTLPPAREQEFVQLENQTLRLIVRTSAGGEALRLRISNTHGTRPLVVGGVSVATQVFVSNVLGIPGMSSKAVTFSAAASFTIPVGAVMISDPVEFAVPQTGNLAVSIYLPEASGFLTSHRAALQTNFISAPGNFLSGDFVVAEEITYSSLLTAVDVVTSAPARTIVALGDSITDGTGSTDSANQRWPDHFTQRLYADGSLPDYSVVIAAIAGNRVTTQASPIFGENLQARFERDVLALSNVSHIILLEGINDIGMSSRLPPLISAGEIINGYRQIIARAHARGIKVYASTLLPYEGAVYYTEEGNAVRLEVNEFIRNSGEFDAVIEFEKVVADPANPNRLRAEFTQDNLHPNDAGYEAMAEVIPLELFR